MEWLASLPFGDCSLLGAINLRANLFDAILLGLLAYGFHIGKCEGASGTWMSCVQWLLIALPGGFMGGFLGSLFRTLFSIGPGWSQFFGYMLWLIVIWGIFAFLASKGVHESVEGDKFGKLEYPLGILLNMFRNFFIILVVLSFLNARAYTSAELEAGRRKQIEELGSVFFPTPTSLHFTFHKNSFTGPKLQRYLGWAILQPFILSRR